MTNTYKEILRRAIKKAFNWVEDEDIEFEGYSAIWVGRILYTSTKSLLFDKDFAKRLWGEQEWTRVSYTLFVNAENRPNVLTEPKILKAYEYHLMQMAISDDPVKYLAESL
jgi:hypothetical protein